MPTLRRLLEAMADELATEIGKAVVKGFPSWGRVDQRPPVLALLLAGLEAPGPTRIGTSLAGGAHGVRWQVYTFARSEPELAELVDKVYGWLAGGEIKVDDERGALRFLGAARYESATGAQQEQYGMVVELMSIF